MTAIIDTIREYREYQRRREDLEARLDALRLDIITGMGDAEELTVGEYRVRYKAVTTQRVDTAALREAVPELAERFCVSQTVRRFSIA